MTRKTVLTRLVPSASSWAAAGRSSARSRKGQSFPLSCILCLSSIPFGGTERGARWQRRLLLRVLAVCGEGGVPHSFPARADFVWIGHTVVPAVDRLVLIICAGFPSPLLTSASIVVKLGLGQEKKGGKLVKVAFPFLFFRQFDLWYVVPSLLYPCVLVLLVEALFSRFIPLCGKFRGILVPEGLHSHFPSSVSLLVGTWALTPELCLRTVI